MGILKVDFLPDGRNLNDANEFEEQNEIPSDVSPRNTSLSLSFLTEDIGQPNKYGARDEEHNDVEQKWDPKSIGPSL